MRFLARTLATFGILGSIGAITACSSKAEKKVVDDDSDDRPRASQAPPATELETLRAHLAEVAARLTAQPSETAPPPPALPPPPTPRAHRYGVRGPANSPDPHIARQSALVDAAEFGGPSVPTPGVGISTPGVTGTSKPATGVRASGATASGSLPAEVIQRIVRRDFGTLRLCYENALVSDPKLEGRVDVDFVIGLDGSVGSVATSGTLPNADVNTCVARQFAAMSFPQPDGGVVKVKYPIAFSPGASSAPTPAATPRFASVAAMSAASLSEVTTALLDAGCSDLQLKSSNATEGTTWVVKKDGRSFTITFVAASDPALDDAFVRGLEAKGAVRRGGASEGNFLFAVVADDGDTSAAKSLLDAILPPP